MLKSRKLYLALALALVLAACGGDTAEETTTSTTTADDLTSTTAAEDATTTTAAASTSSTGAAETTTTAGGTSGVEGDLASLQQAMAQTAESAPSRVEGLIRMEGLADAPAETVEMPFSVITDPATGNNSMTMDFGAMAAIGGEDIPPEMAELMGSMEIRQIGDTVYMKFPFFTAFLGAETEWVSMPAEEDSVAEDMTPGAAPNDPGSFLDSFKDVEGRVEVVGTEDVRGISTTHYQIIIDEEWMAEMSEEDIEDLEEQGFVPGAEFPLNLWVADDGLVHRMSITTDASQLEDAEEFESMTMTFDFFDFGESVTIEPPPADQVTDMENLTGGFTP
jgi:hypothetical protein